MVGMSFAAGGFTLTNVGLPGVANSSVATGDFNQDGRTDVLVTGADTSFNRIAQVWQLQSSGMFTDLNAGLTGIANSSVARGDFDNDGRLDLLITGFVGVDESSFPIYLTEVWRNSGNGTFAKLSTTMPGVNNGSVALGDFDNDSHLDILLTGISTTGAVAQVWRNTGNATFTNIHAGLPGVLNSAVAWADYDGDGHLDFVLTGTPDGFSDSAISQLWRNLGNGTFATNSTVLPGISRGAVAWGDLDQDERLDLLLTGLSPTGAVSQVWRNTGNGSFTNLSVNGELPNVFRSAVALGDFDNDGRLDIVMSGSSPTGSVAQIWRNLGSGAFTNINAGFPGLRLGSVAWADFNNDGRLDVLLTGLDNSSTPTLQVYSNDTPMGSEVTPQSNGVRTLADSSPFLSFAAELGFSYTVWASTNLVQWAVAGSPNTGSPGTLHFSDRQAVDFNHRFYRLTRP